MVMERRLSIEWGKVIDFHGRVWEGNEKDILLHGTTATKWDWKVHGMHHSPGIREVDLKELVDRDGVNSIILSTGFDGVLKVTEEAIRYCESKRVAVRICRSEEAVELYNILVRTLGNKLVGMIHSTC